MHWVIHFDVRGEHSLRYRCKNVNLVEKTVKGVEDELEFLFVPCGRLALPLLSAFSLTIAAPHPPPPSLPSSSLQILRVHRHFHDRSSQNHRCVMRAALRPPW